jgi:hypothetical protein
MPQVQQVEKTQEMEEKLTQGNSRGGEKVFMVRRSFDYLASV